MRRESGGVSLGRGSFKAKEPLLSEKEASSRHEEPFLREKEASSGHEKVLPQREGGVLGA